ncbi:uncharacterized protein LOC111613392 isoform X2 [Centruroides sculpturatus]|nr:uncharacterized protein LOC111613392 isoform X2 [Centruroides sculpturatus]
MSGFPMYMRSDFFHLLDYSSIVNVNPVTFIVKQRKKESTWKSIIRPFSLEVWILILVFILITGFILSRILKNENKLRVYEKFCSVKNTIWILFSSVVLQGSNLDFVTRFSSRLIIGIWLLCAVVLGYGYGGILMSFLTAADNEWIPTNFYELADAVKRQEFSCGTTPIGKYAIFKEAGSGVAKVLFEHMEKNQNYVDYKTARERVENERFAYIQTTHIIKKTFPKRSSNTKVMTDETLRSYYSAFYLRKNFPYKRKISKIVTRMFESGLIMFHLTKYPEYPNDENSVSPLTWNEFFGSFTILAIGYFFALICFVGELFIRKRKKNSIV